jgi:hypothetical protein
MIKMVNETRSTKDVDGIKNVEMQQYSFKI